ncbi:MAG TPA: hypothetical protein VGB54_14750, partial [Allosphingosinicella sp.]
MAAAAFAAPLAAHAQPGNVAPGDILCTPSSNNMPAGSAFPSEAALIGAADRVEQVLAALRARGDASQAGPELLALSSSTQGSPPPPLALARYCAAAGELMRLSARGSQRQALNYLLAAYRLSDGTGDSLAARAAYRIAMIGITEPGADGTRGSAGPARRGTAPPVSLEQRAALPADSSCGELTAAGIAALTAREVSLLALSCAADQAAHVGDGSLAALSNLKLARLEGSFAELPGQDRETFRAFARERAQQAIAAASALDRDPDQVELVGRLAEAALDYGDSGSAQVQAALATLAARGTEPQAASIAAALRARLAIGRGDLAAARLEAEAAILAESRRPVPARLPLHYLLLAQADPDRRVQHVHAAYVALENLRPLLPRLDPLTEESSFGLYMRSVFAAAADVQLASTDDGGASAGIRRAQEIVEAYRQAELQSAFGSECLPAR